MGRFENNFEVELTKLINQHSLENLANIPDYVIMHYLVTCLEALNNAVQARDQFFNIDVWKDSNLWGSKHDDY